MYDQAFYDAAADHIPVYVFQPLLRAPTEVPCLPGTRALETNAIAVRFTPGDATLYEVTIVRGKRNEALATVNNFNLAFRVPWYEGAHVHHTYLGGQPGANRSNDCTNMAVAAVVNRAIQACFEEPTWAVGAHNADR